MKVHVESEGSLGKVQKTLRPKKENVYAGYGIAFILCIGAAYLLYLDPDKHILFSVILLVSAAGMVWYTRRLSRLTISIHEHGFVVHRGRSRLTFPWNQITCVKEHNESESIPLARGITGAMAKKVANKTARSYTVVRDDGQEFFFNNNTVPRGSLLAGPLRTAQRQHDFQWNASE
ncbi:MAG: hypothetical protein AAFV88_02515 [Planctomycetota bacterium]